MAARTPAAPDRFLIGIVAGSILIVLTSIIAVVFLREPPVRAAVDSNSPVSITHAYIAALRDGESDRAVEFLSQSARASMEKQPEPRPRFMESPDRRQRIVVEPVDESIDRATVRVTVSMFTARSDPFSTGSWHNEIIVRLVRENGAWRISQPAEPYPFF